MARLYSALVGSLFFAVVPSVALSASLWLGGLEVTVGIQRETLLAAMQAHEAVCPAEPGKSVQPIDCGYIFIRRKQAPADEWVGSVAFDGNVVSRVEKFWGDGYEGTNPSKFAVTLYALLRNAIGDDGTVPAQLSIRESRDVGVSLRDITLRVKGRMIVISEAEGLKDDAGKTTPAQTILSEIIEASP